MDDQNIPSSDLMQMLLHQYPFLLIDGVVACEPGKSIGGFKNVTRVECTNAPPTIVQIRGVMPVLVVLEALAQLSFVLARKVLGRASSGKVNFFVAGIDDARFGEAAQPGDRLEVETSAVRILPTRGVGKFATRATVGGRLVAEATMIAMPA